MLGILLRAMIGVTASDSPELVGPQIAWTLSWLIISCVALTALVGSPCVSRVRLSILRPLTPPAALIVSAAYLTPRSNPIAGAELAPVIAASQPMRIGSDWAMAGRARPNIGKVEAAAPPIANLRRVIFIFMLPLS